MKFTISNTQSRFIKPVNCFRFHCSCFLGDWSVSRYSRTRVVQLSKASDTLGDFIRRSPQAAKIVRCARYSDCDFAISPRSAYKIADIRHVRYRRLNSPAFAKCTLSRDFLRSLLRIASKANPSGWAILSHEFSKLYIAAYRRKKSPGVFASIGGKNRKRFSLAMKFAAIRRIKSPGVSPALRSIKVGSNGEHREKERST